MRGHILTFKTRVYVSVYIYIPHPVHPGSDFRIQSSPFLPILIVLFIMYRQVQAPEIELETQTRTIQVPKTVMVPTTVMEDQEIQVPRVVQGEASKIEMETRTIKVPKTVGP